MQPVIELCQSKEKYNKKEILVLNGLWLYVCITHEYEAYNYVWLFYEFKKPRSITLHLQFFNRETKRVFMGTLWENSTSKPVIY